MPVRPTADRKSIANAENFWCSEHSGPAAISGNGRYTETDGNAAA